MVVFGNRRCSAGLENSFRNLLQKYLQRLLCAMGVQIVPLTPAQKEYIKHDHRVRYRHFVAQDALALPHGQINHVEARFIGQLVSCLTDSGPIVELGTLFGWSARIVCLFKESDSKLISVDDFSWNPLDFPPDLHLQNDPLNAL